MELDVIASRCLTLNAGEKEVKITVDLGRPYHEPDEVYFCLYRITGMGPVRTNKAAGVDGIQAIQLALVQIGAELYSYSKHLNWEGEPYAGFPTSIYDPAVGENRKLK